ncbi:hypothetical protein BDY24DRAFT_396088 [Mrakia frigida]|uniref:uncharacterized protein n=1 Tax=Mrakia frigida TaxID=29902 RepID=UPI003FCC1FA8
MPRPIPSALSPSKPSPYAKPPALPKSSYLLTFGKHQNTSLASLPRAYLSFLLKAQAYRNKPDLHQALIDEGFMLEDGSVGPNKPPVTPRKKKVVVEEERREKLEGWKLPTEHEELVRNGGAKGGLDDWITAFQAYKKYRVSENVRTRRTTSN